MSFSAKRELLIQIVPRYAEASLAQKGIILGEFSRVTGYSRKYAIRILSQSQNLDIPIKTAIKRVRSRKYGPEVQQALSTAWAASNFICAKRLVPFLPELPDRSKPGAETFIIPLLTLLELQKQAEFLYFWHKVDSQYCHSKKLSMVDKVFVAPSFERSQP